MPIHAKSAIGVAAGEISRISSAALQTALSCAGVKKDLDATERSSVTAGIWRSSLPRDERQCSDVAPATKPRSDQAP